jgi:NADPH:quinone reductase-like Zn-dependent oxidoreductase
VAVPITAITAIQSLQKFGKIQPGEKVLIIGASGGTGTQKDLYIFSNY